MPPGPPITHIHPHAQDPLRLRDDPLRQLGEEGDLVRPDVFTPTEVPLLRTEVPAVAAGQRPGNPHEPGQRVVPQMAHERDRQPLEALPDDCLLQPVLPVAA